MAVYYSICSALLEGTREWYTLRCALRNLDRAMSGEFSGFLRPTFLNNPNLWFVDLQTILQALLDQRGPVVLQQFLGETYECRIGPCNYRPAGQLCMVFQLLRAALGLRDCLLKTPYQSGPLTKTWRTESAFHYGPTPYRLQATFESKMSPDAFNGPVEETIARLDAIRDLPETLTIVKMDS